LSHSPVFLRRAFYDDEPCFRCSTVVNLKTHTGLLKSRHAPASSSLFWDPLFLSYTRPTIIPAWCLVIDMNCRTFFPSVRPPKAPRHEAGSTPRHLIPCRYFARGYCSRGDSCMFSHSLHDPTQFQGCLPTCSTLRNTHRLSGLQGNHAIIPYWNNYSSESYSIFLDVAV
jgi:hypothetical protein